MQAYSREGTLIVGTLETIPGKAIIKPGSFTVADGKLSYEYQGGTEVLWDEQKTVKRAGKIIYLDEDGETWTEDHIQLRPYTEEAE